MPIERKLTAEQFESAPEEDKLLYVADEDGSYKFVGENVGQLKRGKERLSAEKHALSQNYAALKDKLAQYEADKEEAERLKDVQKSNTEAVEAKWKKKYDRDLAQQKEQLTRLQNTIRGQHRASAIAAEVSEVALPQYKELVYMLYDKRVDVELDTDNIPRVVVKDQEGKNSLDSIKDLTESFKKDKRYKDILKADSAGSGTVKQLKANDGQIPPVGDSVGQPSLGLNVPQGQTFGVPQGQELGVPQGQNLGMSPQNLGGLSHEQFNHFIRTQNPEELAKFTGPLPPETETSPY